MDEKGLSLTLYMEQCLIIIIHDQRWYNYVRTHSWLNAEEKDSG